MQAAGVTPRRISRDATVDGSKAGTRFHHGLVAQEVAKVIARTGVD